MAFGKLLKEFRESAGLTQEALAERAGVSGRAISALEQGVNRTPRRDTLDRLVAALGLPTRKQAQLVAAAFPESTLSAVAQPGLQNVPLPATPLLGREGELDAVTHLLQQPEVRLVTLTGPGGVGKTRLALQVAVDIADGFDDGVWFVELDDIRDPDDVAAAIGRMFALRESGEQSIVHRVLGHLRGKHLLLVLDNFEHLAGARPLVTRLLAAAPRLTLLITSRARLRLRAEHEYVVPPLAVPAPGAADAGLDWPAVALFTQRARAAGASLSLTPANVAVVVEICRKLDGLPLAIELAASRAKVLPPAALLDRLDRRLALLSGGAIDLPERQRTMRGALDWTYDLLGPSEQAAFGALSVCVGGCSLDAAQAILGWDSPDRVLDIVGVLVDHSLVFVRDDPRHEPRLGMLQTIREYGLERLAQGSQEAQVRARHAGFVVRAAEEASPHLIDSPRQGEWLEQLELERGNVLAALTWAREHAEYHLGVRLVSAFGPFWYFRGYLREGRYWIDLFLAATAADPNPSLSRLWLLYGACKLALEQGDYARASEVASQSLALAQRLDDPRGMSQALELCGTLALVSGDGLGGRAPLEQSVFWARRAGDRGQLERSLFWLGQASRAAGDLARAELAFEELLAASRSGPAHGTARLLLSLGHVARDRGDDPRATTRYCEALDVFAEMRDPAGVAACCEGLSGLARQDADMPRATRLASAAAALRTSVASELPPAEQTAFDAHVAAARLALGDALFDALWAQGQALTLEQVVAYAAEHVIGRPDRGAT